MNLKLAATLIAFLLVTSSAAFDSQEACMRNCVSTFLSCARLNDEGCCKDYIPCMKQTCKAKSAPCHQQTSSEFKRGSWNKRDEESDSRELYEMLFGRMLQ